MAIEETTQTTAPVAVTTSTTESTATPVEVTETTTETAATPEDAQTTAPAAVTPPVSQTEAATQQAQAPVAPKSTTPTPVGTDSVSAKVVTPVVTPKTNVAITPKVTPSKEAPITSETSKTIVPTAAKPTKDPVDSAFWNCSIIVSIWKSNIRAEHTYKVVSDIVNFVITRSGPTYGVQVENDSIKTKIYAEIANLVPTADIAKYQAKVFTK